MEYRIEIGGKKLLKSLKKLIVLNADNLLK